VVVIDGGVVVEDGSYDDLSVDPNSKYVLSLRLLFLLQIPFRSLLTVGSAPVSVFAFRFAKLMASQLVIQDSHEGVAKRPDASSIESDEDGSDSERAEGQAGEDGKKGQQPGMKIKEEGVLKGRDGLGK
jgi:hypothetical protein